MMTSRSEYRLILRQDNADQRLSRIGHSIGLLSEERYAALRAKETAISREIKRVQHCNIAPSDALADFLTNHGTTPLTTGCKLADLIRRPQLAYSMLAPFDPDRPVLPEDVGQQVELEIKYAGYIEKQLAQVAQMRGLEEKLLPNDADYSQVRGLRLEAAEKLNRQRPINIGQASRISGVSPADISVLLVWLSQRGKQNATEL